jgi:hypothetical protein
MQLLQNIADFEDVLWEIALYLIIKLEKMSDEEFEKIPLEPVYENEYLEEHND